MTNAKGKNVIVLDRVLCIHYSVQFRKGDQKVTRPLIDFNSEINMMTLVYAKRLGLRTCQIKFEAQKMNNLSLEIFEIGIASFQIVDKFGRVQFFKETFLLVEISIKIVLKISFLTLSNMEIQFTEKKLI